MFNIERFCSLCHFMLIRSALPGFISVVVINSVFTSSLFTTKATPAEAVRFVGRFELNTISLRPNSLFICCTCSLLKCVSCRHRMPIFCSRITLCMVVHLDSGPGLHSGAERPFMFSVAIRIFARERGFVGLVLCVLLGGAARYGWFCSCMLSLGLL